MKKPKIIQAIEDGQMARKIVNTPTEKSKGMLFKGEMVNGLLNVKPGTWPAEPIDAGKAWKWQTRRIGKLQSPTYVELGISYVGHATKGQETIATYSAFPGRGTARWGICACPYPVGTILYVRESYYQFGHWVPVVGKKTKGGKQKWAFQADDSRITFEEPESFRKGRHHKDPATPAWHKRLGRFMPRWASRITLEVVRVRVEKFSDITAEDAIAEGIEPIRLSGADCWKNYHEKEGPFAFGCPETSYRSLIESINGPSAWGMWCWAYDLKRIK